jgi:hypothetical protein
MRRILEVLQWAGLGLIGLLKPVAKEALHQTAQEAFNSVLKAKGLDDEWLTVEALGEYFPDPILENIIFLMEAMRYLVSNHPIFASNLRRVIGSSYWNSLGGGEKEIDESRAAGFSRQLKKAKGDAKRRRNCIAFFCSGTKSMEEVLERIETAGLFNEAPDGGIQAVKVSLKKAGSIMGKAIAAVPSVEQLAEASKNFSVGAIDAADSLLNHLALVAIIIIVAIVALAAVGIFLIQ